MTTNSDHPVHIFNEIDPLKEVLVWGEPGCEALLAQRAGHPRERCVCTCARASANP